MPETPVSSPPPRKRRWLRICAWALGVLVVLLVFAYFFGTSTACLKHIILPQVGKAIGANITVSDASIHPFREITLSNLKVQPEGQPPILTAPEVRLQYHLLDLIGGRIRVDEVSVTDPTVLLVENPDGTSNLDPLLKAQPKAAAKPAPVSKPGKPPQIEVGRLILKNATLRQEKRYSQTRRDLTELSNVNIELDNLGNGRSSTLAASADLQVEKNPPPPGAAAQLQARLDSKFKFVLSAALKLVSLEGSSEVLVPRAEGALGQLAGFRSTLNCAATATNIQEIALRFQKNQEPLGELRVSGPFDIQTAEGRLNIELVSIDKRLLNLVGAGSGLDFGTTTVDSTNEIQLAEGGSKIDAAGGFDLNQLQVTRAGQKTPVLDLHVRYDVGLNTAANRALIRAFTLNGTENGSPLLQGSLTQPMNVGWGNASNAVGDSALDLAVTNLDLADWKPFFGAAAPEGRAGLNLHLLSQAGGQQLTFDLNSDLADLRASVGSNRIAGAGLALAVHGQAAGLKQFKIDHYELDLTHQAQPALTLSGSAAYNADSKAADAQLQLQASLARLLEALPQPGASATSGTLDLKAHLAQIQDSQSITGSLRLSEFTGQFGQSRFNAFGSDVAFDIAQAPGRITINRAAGSLTQDGKPGGGFDVSGSYDLTNKTAELKATLAGFNQLGLGSFLQPSLGDKKLVSIHVDGDASIQYDPEGSSSVQAAIQVTNLVVNDPRQQFPATPLEASLRVDTALQKQSADLRQLQVTLSPTERAQNQIQLQGHVDFSNSKAIEGSLKLSSDSIDLTRYYDLFAAKPAANAETAAPQAPTSQPAAAVPAAPGGAAPEPATNQLPFHNFSVEVAINRLYLREVEITNLDTGVNLDGGRVLLKPCALSLNGAPIGATADLDLGVPGYKYALAFDADKVPFAPLVDTFAPDRKGQLGGTLTAHAQVSGQGTTGAALQKTLSGQFDIGTTNLNLSVVNVHSAILKSIINVVATIPELLHNPAAGVGALFGGITGKSGIMNELSSSPIEVVSARGSAGNGRVDLQQAVVRSAAFEADAQGPITIAPVLTNSTIQIPIAVFLSYAIAEQLNLASGTNAPYVRLPDFLTIKGTLGEPKPDVNKMALVSTTFKALSGSGTGTSNKPGLLQDLGGLLGKKSQSSGGTNAPAGQSPLNNMFNNFFHSKK